MNEYWKWLIKTKGINLSVEKDKEVHWYYYSKYYIQWRNNQN